MRRREVRVPDVDPADQSATSLDARTVIKPGIPAWRLDAAVVLGGQTLGIDLSGVRG